STASSASGLLRRRSNAERRPNTPSGTSSRSLGLQHLLGDPPDDRRVHLALVRLHAVADQAAHLLGVGDLERVEALAHERAQRRLVHAPGQVTLAELELEAQLRGMRGAALAHLLEPDEGPREPLPAAAEPVRDERAVG